MTDYTSSAIEVLAGLEPVRRRPGMYTQTERPNHLAQEVVDNAVDEAMAGHAGRIEIVLFADGSMSVADDGRGMPVDIHAAEGVSGVEVILTRLHAGAKFSQKAYTFSGGLHGVGVSVVNALSTRLEVRVKRDGREHFMAFENGAPLAPLAVVGEVGRRNTGTSVRFWPDPQFFDVPTISVSRLKRQLRAKAVLCSGLRIEFRHEGKPEDDESWYYEDGIADYLLSELGDRERVPDEPFTGHVKGPNEEVEWAVLWLADDGEPLGEAYVNLIPTPQGGTHTNGLRLGLTEALREFCEFRNLLPRGLKLAPEDVWSRVAYLVSLKMKDPVFTGQTKERLASREAASFIAGATKDALSLWLNHHVQDGERIAQLAIASAQKRLRAAQKVERKRVAGGPALPGKLADCTSTDLSLTELFLVEGDSAGGSAKQARSREFQAIMPLRGKILNTWEVESDQVLGSQEVHDIAVALGVDPGSADLSGLRYGKVNILADADSDGAHIASLLCALFLRHFRPLVASGRVFVAMPPLYRIDAGKQVFYALDDSEKKAVIDKIQGEKANAKITVQRFKGLGEMNPSQLRETTMAPETRRLVRLELGPDGDADALLDMLLAKKRAADRRQWLFDKGDLAEIA